MILRVNIDDLFGYIPYNANDYIAISFKVLEAYLFEEKLTKMILLYVCELHQIFCENFLC